MNIEQVAVIEGLARAACHINGTDASKKLLARIVDVLEGSSDSEELKALEASNRIKQANINLLADSIYALAVSLEFTSVEAKAAVMLSDLQELARSLKQEDTEAPAAVVN